MTPAIIKFFTSTKTLRIVAAIALSCALLVWIVGRPPAEVVEPEPVATASPVRTDLLGSDPAPVQSPVESPNVRTGGQLAVLDIAEHARDNKNAIAVTLNAPLDPAKTHELHLNVAKVGGGRVDGAWVLGSAQPVIYFPEIEPNTEYEITVYRGLRGKHGASLDRTVTKRIKTRPLAASVTFDTSGTHLPARAIKGLPVLSVNVDAVDINFHRVKASAMNQFLDSVRHNRWRRWYGLHRLGETTELVYTARFELSPPKNTRHKVTIPLSDVKELKEPGLYVAVMGRPGAYNHRQQVTYFAITDIGLHARVYAERIDVYLSSLATAKPLANVLLSLFDTSGKLVSETNSTPEGLASFSNPARARMLVAQTATHYSMLDLSRAGLDLSEFDVGMTPDQPITFFTYGPRELYRPGELAHFSGLLRDDDGRSIEPLTIAGKIKRPDGALVKDFVWQRNKLGYYNYQFPIPKEAPTGQWSLEIYGGGEKIANYPFKVEEFLPERLRLSFPTVAEQATHKGDKSIAVPVVADYHYGAPAANNRISARVRVRAARNPIPALKDFEFGDANSTALNQTFELEDLFLDEAGRGTFTIEPRWGKAASPLEVILIGSVYESGGRPVTRTRTNLVWPADALVGIRSHSGDSNPAPHARARFDIVKSTLDGEQVAAVGLQAKLIREDRQYFWEYSDGGGWHYEFSQQEFVVSVESLAIEAGSFKTLELPLEWGRYRVEVFDPESGLTSSIRVHAGDDWYARWRQTAGSSQAARPDRVSLALDQAAYVNGDVARVAIVPPHAGEAIVTVESDRLLWSKRQFIPAEGGEVEIPIAADWRHHGIYVSATVLRAGAAKSEVAPNRAFGIIHLPLDRRQRRLEIDFTVEEKVRPEQPFVTTLKVNSSGKSEEIYVTLAAVDVGVLSVTDFDTPDPHTGFFGQKRYTAQPHDMYSELIAATGDVTAELRFGGDADLQRGGQAPASEVRIISLFNAPVRVDADGEATIELTIPEFNGKVRLMALAYSEDSFGSAETEVIVAAPIVTQFSMPRFLAPGDKSSVALDIHNISGSKQQLKLKLSATGAVSMPAFQQQLSLDDQEKRTIQVPINGAQDIGQGVFQLHVESGSLPPLTRQWRLGVRPAYPALVRLRRQVLKPGQEFRILPSEFDGLMPATAQLLLSVSPSANLNIESHLEHLLRYPYGCLEQTTSSAFPLVWATKENQTRFNLESITEQERAKRVDVGIVRLAGMQRPNGGFGLWGRHSPEEFWLSAYVSDFLLTAQEQGFDVPQQLLNSALNRLTQYVSRDKLTMGRSYSQSLEHYELAYKAYAAYVLARVNRVPLAALRVLYDNDADDAKSAVPLVHLGIAFKLAGDQRRAEAALKRALARSRPAHAYYGDYGSDIRDQALLIHLLLRHQLYEDAALRLAFDLSDQLHRRTWLSTQERNSLFLAGVALGVQEHAPWQATLSVAGTQEQIHTANSLRRRIHGGADNEISLAAQGPATVFASAEIFGYPINAPPPQGHGFDITRVYYDMHGEPVELVEAQLGQLYLVHLSVAAKQRTPDALLVDLLPAGLEIENQNLDHAIKIDEIKIEGQTIEEMLAGTDQKHQEFREDRYVAALDLRASQRTHVFYLVRAVTPGEYHVPPPYVEDMYRPERRAIGATPPALVVYQR